MYHTMITVSLYILGAYGIYTLADSYDDDFINIPWIVKLASITVWPLGVLYMMALNIIEYFNTEVTEDETPTK